jgi:hypothetical protein
MSQRKTFSRFVAFALILFFAPIFVFGATIALTGMVTIDVRTADGPNIFVPVPAILLDVAVLLAPLVMPEEALAEARREIAPYQESLELIANELRDCPSGTLVEVKGRNEHVKVSKSWRSFEVAVESDDADVTVKVPARLMSRALDVL